MINERVVVNYPATVNEEYNKLAKSYLDLKRHEFISIINKLTSDNYSFKNINKESSFYNYKDYQITLLYSYGYRLIREDKFIHFLDDELIDINHFVKETDYLKEELKESLLKKLKKYKIKESMIDLTLLINLDNFIVIDGALEFIYSLNQFGINSTDEVRVITKLKDYYYE